jgi:hypothetical protein
MMPSNRFSTFESLKKYSLNTEIEKILNVYYVHLKFNSQDDLYITKYGLPFIEYLRPENYISDKKWFKENSTRLSGTSCTYLIHTKPTRNKNLMFVIKYNRMGQDIPGEDHVDDLSLAEFNSPFEEFALVMELRKSKYESPIKIITQKPLAIYVPNERVELWRIGRNEYKMQMKIKKHSDIKLDMFRPYVVVYEWVKGIDAAEAHKKGYISEMNMKSLTLRADSDMRQKGFLVRDRKPHHVIIRPKKKGGLFRDRDGQILYALVDFELLDRTPERERIVRTAKRKTYLKRQLDRFKETAGKEVPPQLQSLRILDVDYIYGHTESTNGALWVVGKDPYLFDYFLPERWENNQKTKLSSNHEIYHTVTKDDIQLVWKVSRVGLMPEMDPYKIHEKKILEYGYNSPFEEISIALYLNHKDVKTIFPRAIYMAGKKTNISQSLLDFSRYNSHKEIVTPDEQPVLQQDRNYMLLWGYWNGPDEKLAALDGDYYRGINALSAYRNHLIAFEDYIDLMQETKQKLAQIGIEDLNLRGSHLLLSVDSTGELVVDKKTSLPEVHICNFEFLKKIK